MDLNMGEWEDMDQFSRWRTQYGWAGTVFVRDDARHVLGEMLNDADAELPDWLWERLKQTWCWRKGIVEAMTEVSWQVIEMGIEEALQEVLDRKSRR